MLPIVIYNSKLAKLLNVYCITIFIFTFTKETNNSLYADDYRHEQIHYWQWLETTIFMLILACFLAYFGIISWWCTLISVLIFYILYGLEWICKTIVLKDTFTKLNTAYRSISAEIEAYDYDSDVNYKRYRIPFNWLKNLFKLKRYER